MESPFVDQICTVHVLLLSFSFVLRVLLYRSLHTVTSTGTSSGRSAV